MVVIPMICLNVSGENTTSTNIIQELSDTIVFLEINYDAATNHISKLETELAYNKFLVSTNEYLLNLKDESHKLELKITKLDKIQSIIKSAAIAAAITAALSIAVKIYTSNKI